MLHNKGTSDRFNRRSMLKGIGAASATGLLLGAAGSAAADDGGTEDCWWDYECTNTQCSDGSGYVQLRRYCCMDPTGYGCDEWETYGCC